MNDRRNEIQNEAKEIWFNSGKIGTLEIITGLGKTFISLHCLHTMPKKDGNIHLFLAETTSRKRDLLTDIQKYDKIFGTNTLNDYNLKFYCYQTVYKWKNESFGLVIADEIHDAMSPSYSKFFINNKYDGLLGLSASLSRDTWYEENGKKYNKGHLIDKICPVIYKYTLNEGQNDGTSRKLDVNVISHELDKINKTVKAGSAKKVFYQTEYNAYKYWDAQFTKALFIEDEEEKSLKLKIASYKRSNILYNLNSKIPVIKKLLNHLPDKTIIFGNSIDALLKITPNVVSSRNSEDENKRLRDRFDSNKINTIGSFKKLKQGANLKDLDNCIIISYYSTEKDLIQKLGRLRKNGEKTGKVFILRTKNTKEIDWFNKMFENIDSFNMKYYSNVDDCIKDLE